MGRHDRRADPDELRRINDLMFAPADVTVCNPAFNATPVENVTAVITEDGVVYPDESESWNGLFS